jgi:predicted transcriptional regulator
VGNVTHMTISRRIEMQTLKKILEFSLTNGPIKKTNMATRCKMSYSRFIPLLNIMDILGLLDVIKETGNYIVITDFGKTVLDKLQNNKMKS